MSSSGWDLAGRWLDHAAAVSLEATVLLVLALGAGRLLKRGAPQLRHALWLLVLLRLALPVGWGSPIGLVGERGTAATVGDEVSTVRPPQIVALLPAAGGGADAASQAPEAAALRPGRPLATILGGAWLVGALLLVLRTARRAARQRRALDALPPPARELSVLAETLAQRIACRRCPPLRVAAAETGLTAPALFGLLRPVIVLPRSMAESWPLDEVEPLLLHELVHLRRRDHWVNALQLWVGLLHFFNPLVWAVNRSLRRERELICDESVVRLCAPRSYLVALLRFAEESVTRAQPGLLAVPLARRASDLVERAETIVTVQRSPGVRRWSSLLGAVIGVVAILLAGPRTQAVGSPAIEPLTTAGELAALERAVQRDPDSVTDRVRLAYSYYLRDSLAVERAPHALWLIENAPGTELPIPGLLSFSRELEPDLHRRSQRLWREQAERGSGDPGVLRNAAGALGVEDPDLALGLLRSGQELEPWNSEWPAKIGLWHLRRSREGATADGAHARSALVAYERALALADGPAQRTLYLAELSRAAYVAGEVARASAAAEELLASAMTLDEAHWNRANALHRGHTILGLVALDAGRAVRAKEELAASAALSGSPQLNSFGPNMSLARRLLLAGEHDAVLDYLDRCLTFWKSPRAREKIAVWTAEMALGRLPDFGPHLVY